MFGEACGTPTPVEIVEVLSNLLLYLLLVIAKRAKAGYTLCHWSSDHHLCPLLDSAL